MSVISFPDEAKIRLSVRPCISPATTSYAFGTGGAGSGKQAIMKLSTTG